MSGFKPRFMSLSDTAAGKTHTRPRLPLVYACSGCSAAAQMANHLALRLDRGGAAEMSCIAGVGGDVPQLLRVARSGRPMLAIDGCELHCVAHTLRRHDLIPLRHYTLSQLGVHKNRHGEFDTTQADAVFTMLLSDLHALATVTVQT